MIYVLALLAFTTAFVFGVLITYIGTNKKEDLLSNLLVIFYGVIIIAGLAYTVFYLTEDINTARIAFKVSLLAWLIVPPLEAQILTVRARRLRLLENIKEYMLYYMPGVVIFLIAVFSDTMILGRDIYKTHLAWGFVNDGSHLWFWVYLVYGVTYISFGLMSMRKIVKKGGNTGVQRRTNAFMLIVGITVVLCYGLDLIIPFTGLNLPSLGILAFLIPGLYLLKNYQDNQMGMNIADTSLEQTIDVMMDMLLIIDMDGLILDCNSQVANELNLKKQDIIGKAVVDTPIKAAFEPRLVHVINSEGQYRNIEIVIEVVKDTKKTYIANATFLKDRFFGDLGYLLVLTDISSRKEMENKLEESHHKELTLAKALYHQANYDSLTDIPNRRFFFRELERLADDYLLTGLDFVVIFIDLNGFKKINDDYGHNIGDIVLLETVKRLQAYKDNYEILARIGGDEFIIVTRNTEDNETLEAFINRIGKGIQRPIDNEGINIKISASMGYSKYSEHEAIEQVIKSADEKMYRRKARIKKD